ncbi:hypothetical protein LguiB_024963 [Lonicera macranthoides]
MDSKNPHNKPTTTHPQKHHPKPTNSELLQSAKLVAEAAQATLRHESDKVEKAKVAGAAADLLNAASTYGKLDEKGLGKYLDKAEDYLHKYNLSQSATANSGHSAAHTTTAIHSSGHSGGGDHSGSEYVKMAEDDDLNGGSDSIDGGGG